MSGITARTSTDSRPVTVAATALAAILADVTHDVDVVTVDGFRGVVASHVGSQVIVRPDRREDRTDAGATFVARRAERRVTVARAANMIAARTDAFGSTAADVIATLADGRGKRGNAPRAMVDALASVHHLPVTR